MLSFPNFQIYIMVAFNNDRFLILHDKEIIVDNITRLCELLNSLEQEYEDHIKELEDKLNQLKGITNGPMDGQESLL